MNSVDGIFFKSVSLKPVFLKTRHIFRFFSFFVISLAFHAGGSLPWSFLLSCTIKAKYSTSPLLKPWLPTRGSISFAGLQEQFPGSQQKQRKIKADQKRKKKVHFWIKKSEKYWISAVFNHSTYYKWDIKMEWGTKMFWVWLFWEGGRCCNKLTTIWGLS